VGQRGDSEAFVRKIAENHSKVYQLDALEIAEKFGLGVPGGTYEVRAEGKVVTLTVWSDREAP
jgi:hypothetical protein